MKIYLVGGAVRDELMGVTPKDRDYVVVGSSHEEMISAGFTQVGAAFPVYLHPETGEEYALARTEVSTGGGYHDFETVFTPEVTIEQDLLRRDLTINAMAKDLDTGEIIDPFGGREDLERKCLNLVHKMALEEDPLRVYRLARFYARFGGDFRIPAKVIFTARRAAFNLGSLPKERKFAEIEKCFSDQSFKNKPSLMVSFLSDLGEFPGIDELNDIPQPPEHHPEGDVFTHTMLCLDYAQALMATPETKWAVLCHDLGKVIWNETGKLHGHEGYGVQYVDDLCDAMGVPNAWRKLAKVVCEHHGRVHNVVNMSPRKVYDLIYDIRAEKEPQFALKVLEACLCDARGRGETMIDRNYDVPDFIWACVVALHNQREAISSQSKAIAERLKGRHSLIKEEVRAVKIKCVKVAMIRARAGIHRIREEQPYGNIPQWQLYEKGVL